MPTTIKLTDEQCNEVRKALNAEITRTQEALSVPFVREIHELRERADNTISVLSAVLDALGPAAAATTMTDRRQ